MLFDSMIVCCKYKISTNKVNKTFKEKAKRFIKGQSSRAGLDTSTPMLTSITSELGFLSEAQAVALRRAVTLDMEMRKEETIEKAQLAVQACEEALKVLYG